MTVEPGTIRTCSAPTATRTGHSASANNAANSRAGSEARGASFFPANPTAKCPMNMRSAPALSCYLLLWLECSRPDLLCHARYEICDPHHILFLSGSPNAERERIALRFPPSHDRHVRDLERLSLANAIVQRFRPLVEMR